MNAFLFDIDGVLTDPKLKQVTEPKLFEHIISLLEAGEPICLNTGRSLPWISERVIDPLIERLKDKKLLANFIAVGEMGGTWMTFDKNAHRKYEIDSTITVPKKLQQAVRELVKDAFSKVVFFDETKETMISVEMNDGLDIAVFHKEHTKLNSELGRLLDEYNLSDSYKIEPAIIATDVENNNVGKALGARRFVQFLKTKNLNPTGYFTFGDSKRDLEMADELHWRGEKVVFVFVGDKEKLDGITKPYPIEFFSGYSQGTLSYLNK